MPVLVISNIYFVLMFSSTGKQCSFCFVMFMYKIPCMVCGVHASNWSAVKGLTTIISLLLDTNCLIECLIFSGQRREKAIYALYYNTMHDSAVVGE